MIKFRSREHAGKELAQKFKGKNQKYSDCTVVAVDGDGVIPALAIAKILGKQPTVLCVNDYFTEKDERLLFTPLGSGFLYGNNGNDDDAKFIPNVHKEFTDKRFKKTFANSVEHDYLFNSRRPFVVPENIILVDDGVGEFGKIAKTAIASLRHHGAEKIIFAVPVLPSWAKNGAFDATLITCHKPIIDSHYRTFYKKIPQLSDQDIITALR